MGLGVTAGFWVFRPKPGGSTLAEMKRPASLGIVLLSLAVLIVGCSEPAGLRALRAAVRMAPLPLVAPGAGIPAEGVVPVEPAASPPVAIAVLQTPTPGPSSPDQVTIPVQSFHEPNDYAHRNYCGAGATQVLLSAWLDKVPDIEAVARQNLLDPRIGQTGGNTVAGINAWLDPVVVPAVGHSWYRGARVTSLDELLGMLREDLTSPIAWREFGHGAPAMVQLMTPTLPGWNRWNATHMITIFAYDLRTHDPAKDTVSFMETPSPVAGYRGPASQTISVKMLWDAMVAFATKEKDRDPINVIW